MSVISDTIGLRLNVLEKIAEKLSIPPYQGIGQANLLTGVPATLNRPEYPVN